GAGPVNLRDADREEDGRRDDARSGRQRDLASYPWQHAVFARSGIHGQPTSEHRPGQWVEVTRRQQRTKVKEEASQETGYHRYEHGSLLHQAAKPRKPTRGFTPPCHEPLRTLHGSPLSRV